MLIGSLSERVAEYDGDVEESNVVGTRRYPYGKGMLIVDLLTLGMGAFVLLIVLGDSPDEILWTAIASSILLAGVAVYYERRRDELRKLERELEESRSEVLLRMMKAGAIRQRAMANFLMVVISVSLPIAFTYVLEPALWSLLLVSVLLSVIIGRVSFFVRTRIWEAQNHLLVRSYTLQLKTKGGATIYERGLLAEKLRAVEPA